MVSIKHFIFAYKIKKMPKTFIINDESKTNSYGFRVSNTGIDLTRFKANPVMLDYHYHGNQSVIGKWENLRIVGSQLLADAIFDEEDEEAKKIQGKVDRGFIKGTSMGLGTANGKWEIIDDVPVLTLCELIEVSIASIPSNANALKLYNSEGVELSVDEINLTINKTDFKPKTTEMKKLNLSAAALMVLALSMEQLEDNSKVEASIEKLTADFKANEVKLAAIEKERNELKAQVKAIDLAKATSLVEEALKSGKIVADKKDYFLELAKSDFDTCKGILDGIPGKKDLSGAKGGASQKDFENIKTIDDFEKLSYDDKLAFKNDNPESYNKLFA